MSAVFGPIRQNGFVVADIAAAMAWWSERMGVGPFFVAEGIRARWYEFDGVRRDPRMSVALSNSGPLQIELIEPLDRTPSMWRQFLDDGHEGLQHVAYWTDDFDGTCAAARSRGLTLRQQGAAGEAGRFAYFDGGGHGGPAVEISEVSGWKGELFAAIAACAEGWDGSEPVRSLGSWPPPDDAVGSGADARPEAGSR